MACNCAALRGQAIISGNATPIDRGPLSEEPLNCGECRSCRKILKDRHPDIINIHPSGAAIKIDQIREVNRRLALKAHEAALRFVVIRNAEKMNTEAGNALLKMLEEPPEKTIFILISRQASDLLPTVVSRCRHIRFNPVSVASLSRFLTEKYDLDSNNAGIIAEMANGSPQRAIMLQETDWFFWRVRLIETFSELHLKPVSVRLAFSEYLAGAKEKLGDVLDIFQSWYRDLIVFPNAPERIINKDMRQTIGTLSRQWPRALLLERLDMLRIARRRIETKANLRLVIDTLILKVTGLGI